MAFASKMMAAGSNVDVLFLVASRKYQFMELNLQKRITGLKDKIPDIQKTLDTVRFLKTRTVRGVPIQS